ncbi:MAG: cell division protein ZapA [Spirochaetaceae bacterium]
MTIELLGTSFTIQTDEDPQYVQDLIDFFRTKVQDVQARITSGDPLKIAIVAGVLTADELFRLREGTAAASASDPGAAAHDDGSHGDDGRHTAAESAQVAEITQKLIEALDRSLADSRPAATRTEDNRPADS